MSLFFVIDERFSFINNQLVVGEVIWTIFCLIFSSTAIKKPIITSVIMGFQIAIK